MNLLVPAAAAFGCLFAGLALQGFRVRRSSGTGSPYLFDEMLGVLRWLNVVLSVASFLSVVLLLAL